MKKHPIRFIYFDVGGVLLNWREGQRRMAAKYNVPVEAIQAVVNDHWKDACRGTLDHRVYMERLSAVIAFGGPIPDLIEFWTEHFTVIQPTHDLVHDLKSSYKLGVLSNAEKGVLRKATGKGLVPDISWHTVIDSSEHGVIKPEPGIYDIAESRAGVRPEEILFIDDVPEHIHVAVARGWHGVIFDTDDAAGSVKKIRSVLAGQSSS